MNSKFVKGIMQHCVYHSSTHDIMRSFYNALSYFTKVIKGLPCMLKNIKADLFANPIADLSFVCIIKFLLKQPVIDKTSDSFYS